MLFSQKAMPTGNRSDMTFFNCVINDVIGGAVALCLDLERRVASRRWQQRPRHRVETAERRGQRGGGGDHRAQPRQAGAARKVALPAGGGGG